MKGEMTTISKSISYKVTQEKVLSWTLKEP